jgi:hypothetical protein
VEGRVWPDLNTRKTLDTQLNVFADFSPKLLNAHLYPEYVFLGNIDPDLQRSVLEQVKRPKLVACDTMNYWIQNKREALLKTLSMVDLLLINDAEALQLAEQPSLLQAARRILTWGPNMLVIKRGEYGALLFNSGSIFSLPAYPVEDVVDPTGAGDSFAGGLMGYLAASGASGDPVMRKAVVFGSGIVRCHRFGPAGWGSDLSGNRARYRDSGSWSSSTTFKKRREDGDRNRFSKICHCCRYLLACSRPRGLPGAIEEPQTGKKGALWTTQVYRKPWLVRQAMIESRKIAMVSGLSES